MVIRTKSYQLAGAEIALQFKKPKIIVVKQTEHKMSVIK